jgi:hypothetical protein
MIQVGSIIKESHLFIERFPQTGETTTDIIVGEDENGTTSEHITVMFNETGRNGNIAGIGKIKTIGECVISSLERTNMNESITAVRCNKKCINPN